MEDAHCAVLDLLTPQGDDTKTHPSRLSFFGVFDGHGGDKVAQFAGKHIPDILLKQDTFKKGNYEQSLKDCFLATDRAILSGMNNTPPGSSSWRMVPTGLLTSAQIPSMKTKCPDAQPAADSSVATRSSSFVIILPRRVRRAIRMVRMANRIPPRRTLVTREVSWE